MFKTFRRRGSVAAAAIVTLLAAACGSPTHSSSQDAMPQSLTGTGFEGKKYYLGWGAASGGDPQMMHNEVKYDVLHTHDIFSQRLGGDYAATKFTGTGNVSAAAITNSWAALRAKMSPKDMFVQYSSGHGFPSGLAVGVGYAQIRDAILAMPAKEIVLITMACYSGGIVDEFNKRKSEWESWGEQGRTLFVLSSSTVQQTSSTGPGIDDDEKAGQEGTAGSAFGHGVWKSLIGYADGYLDGVKDGFISLGELQAYTTYKTKSIGGHDPVHTGVFNVNLIMNQVPSKAQVAALMGANGSEGLSDERIQELVREADEDIAADPS